MCSLTNAERKRGGNLDKDRPTDLENTDFVASLWAEAGQSWLAVRSALPGSAVTCYQTGTWYPALGRTQKQDSLGQTYPGEARSGRDGGDAV